MTPWGTAASVERRRDELDTAPRLSMLRPMARHAMTEVRWGIIGCGDVTEVKSGPALQGVAGSRVVAVTRRDPAKAADYARRHGVPRWHADADALLADPEVNAVYVATPPGTHLDFTLKALAAGKPVYVEKPMARSAPSANGWSRRPPAPPCPSSSPTTAGGYRGSSRPGR